MGSGKPGKGGGKDPVLADGTDARGVPSALRVGKAIKGQAPVEVALVPGSHLSCLPDLRAAATSDERSIRPVLPGRQVPSSKLVSVCPEALHVLKRVRVARGDVLLVDSRIDREVRPGAGAATEAAQAPAGNTALQVSFGQAWQQHGRTFLPALLKQHPEYVQWGIAPLAAHLAAEAALGNSTGGVGDMAPWPVDVHDMNTEVFGPTSQVPVRPPDDYWAMVAAADAGALASAAAVTEQDTVPRALGIPSLAEQLERWTADMNKQ